MAVLTKSIETIREALIFPYDAPEAVLDQARKAATVYGDLIEICNGTNDEVNIHAIRDAAETANLPIRFIEGHYMLKAPVEWNVSGQRIICPTIPSGLHSEPFVDKGVQFKADTGFVGNYVMRVSARDIIFDNLFIHANNLVNNGLELYPSIKCTFGYVVIYEPEQIGLYLYGTAGDSCRSNNFIRLEITMLNSSSATIRGIVLDGVGGGAGVGFATVNKFWSVYEVIKSAGVATSRALDFVQYADGNYFDYLQIGGGDLGYNPTGVVFNSGDPNNEVGVRSNKIHYFIQQPPDQLSVVANRADEGRPNVIDYWQYRRSSWRGGRGDLKVLDYGVKPYKWKWDNDSLDGIVQGTNDTGSITQGNYYTQLETGANSGSWARLLKGLQIDPAVDWDRRRFICTKIYFDAVTDQEIWIVTGQNGQPMVGFFVEDNSLYGITSDGVEEKTLLQTIVAGTEYELEAHLFPGIEANFYVDKVYKNSNTAHLPSGGSATVMKCVRIRNTAAANKIIRYAMWEFEIAGEPR